MFRFINILLSFIFTTYVVIFAVFNQQNVTIDLVGLGYVLTLPLFILLIIILLIGVLMGGFVVWIGQRKYRVSLKHNKIALSEMEQTLNDLKENNPAPHAQIDVGG